MAGDRVKCRSGGPGRLESTEGSRRSTIQLLPLQTPRGGERPERAWAPTRSGVKEPTTTGSGFEQSNRKMSFWG